MDDYSIKFLKDENGTKFFPLTGTKGVIDENGNNLEQILSQFAKVGESAAKLNCTYNSETGVLTISLLNKNNITIDSKNVTFDTLIEYIDNMTRGITENYTIDNSDWVPLEASADPYTYKTTVTADEILKPNVIGELINDNVVLFANYGFVIESVVNQQVTIYATDIPTEAITLRIRYKQ